MFLEEEKLEENKDLIVNYHCEDCGLSFSALSSREIHDCIFCHSKKILKEESFPLTDKFLIPFQKTLGDAIKEYKKKTFYNPLVPFIFKKKSTIQSIQKVYLPVFLANVNAKGNISFYAGDKTKIVKDKEKMIETKRYDVLQSVNFDFSDVLLNISSKIDDNVFYEIGNFSYQNKKEMESSDLIDSSYIVGDIDVNDIAEKGRERILNHILRIARDNIHHVLKKVHQNDIIIRFNNTKEVFLPVYLLTIEYNHKSYLFVMNGETGKFDFELPIGMIEVAVFSGILFSILFLISFLIAYFL